jgi:hypothetical protein
MVRRLGVIPDMIFQNPNGSAAEKNEAALKLEVSAADMLVGACV